MIQELEALLGRIKELDDRTREKVPEGDLRIGITGLPGNVLHTFLLYVAMSDTTIGRKTWWQQAYGDATKPNDSDLRAVAQLDVLTKHSVFVFFMSRIEWTMRKLVTFLDTEACNGGRDHFQNIYQYLLKKLDLSEFVLLYDVCRLVRNSVHTNGRFVPRTGNDTTISWNGRDYAFRDLEPIDFVAHDVLFSLYHDLVDSLDAILQAGPIAEADFIEDTIHT